MNRRFFRPELESLSDRILLSATPSLSTMLLPKETAGVHGHVEHGVAKIESRIRDTDPALSGIVVQEPRSPIPES